MRLRLLAGALLTTLAACKTSSPAGSSAQDLAATTAAPIEDLQVVKRSVLNVRQAAFVTATPDQVLISAFPLPSQVSTISPADLLRGNSGGLHVATTKVIWPNKPVAAAAAGQLILPGGFLVPLQIGGVHLHANGSTTKITADKFSSGAFWFYHKAIEQDFNGDGKLDLLVARAVKPLISKLPPQGELLWLENPGDGSTPWVEHHLADGPDVNFLYVDLDHSGSNDPLQKVVIAAQFFSQKLMLYWWDSSGAIQSTTIDDSIGSVFDLQLVDLNGDGQKELLVTNHMADPNVSGVFAYEIPADFRHQAWTRHTLLTGIKTTHPGQNQDSPGTATAFWPNVRSSSGKPWIIVSGDGAERVFLLRPTPTPWQYTVSDPLQAAFGAEVAPETLHSTMGGIETADLDGDGYQEIIVPAYDAGKIYTFSLQPAAASAQ